MVNDCGDCNSLALVLNLITTQAQLEKKYGVYHNNNPAEAHYPQKTFIWEILTL